MSNPQKDVRTELVRAREQLELLQELELLESEFRLIRNEYLKRKQDLSGRLAPLNPEPAEEAVPEAQ